MGDTRQLIRALDCHLLGIHSDTKPAPCGAALLANGRLAAGTDSSCGFCPKIASEGPFSRFFSGLSGCRALCFFRLQLFLVRFPPRASVSPLEDGAACVPAGQDLTSDPKDFKLPVHSGADNFIRVKKDKSVISGVGLHDPRGSFPIQEILWFYDFNPINAVFRRSASRADPTLHSQCPPFWMCFLNKLFKGHAKHVKSSLVLLYL